MIYKFTLAPLGAVGTPFRSDTLFGHACWTIRQHEGEMRTGEFIKAASEQKPELVFSDGFPSGWLPRPLLPEIPRHFSDSVEYSRMKNVEKRRWVNRGKAEQCQWDSLTIDKSAGEDVVEYSDKPSEHAMLRNVIDRMTGTSLIKDGLYSQNQQWYEGVWEKIDIYISTEWAAGRLASFLETMFTIGYGRDQTVGLGKVKIVENPVPSYFSKTDSDWYMSLSRMVPNNKFTLNDSFYQIEAKYGKVWSALGQKNPFKKRILQTVPGSVFKINGVEERAGCVLANVHDNTGVIENCMAVLYPLPVTALQGVVQ